MTLWVAIIELACKLIDWLKGYFARKKGGNDAQNDVNRMPDSDVDRLLQRWKRPD